MAKILCYRHSVVKVEKLFAICLVVLMAAPLAAQPELLPAAPDEFLELPPGVTIVDSIYDPDRPAGPDNDPGTEQDPSTLFDPATWEEMSPEKYPLDASYLEFPGDNLLFPETGCVPSATKFCGPKEFPAPPAAGCGGWNAELSRPIKVFGPFPNYFSYAGQMTPLVGVSADNGCHLFLNPPSGTVPPDNCDIGNYQAVLTQLEQKQLNKIRLWVGFGADVNPDNQPFKQVSVASLGTFWSLNEKNDDYFRRLREVVAYARQKNLFVEVTFFAPWEGGDFPAFRAGPWGGKGRCRLGCDAECGDACPAGTGTYGPVRQFTRWENFVQANRDANTGVISLVDPALQKAQENLVRWTVRELWCYDHIYWELGNEQEGLKCGSGAGEDPCTALDQAKLQKIANWNQLLIGWVQNEEAKFGRQVTTRHLIGVQPFTDRGTRLAIANGSIAVINGHYTSVSKSLPALDTGAFKLIRELATSTRIFGFNEGKIVKTFVPEDGPNIGGGTFTRTRRNGTLYWGAAAPARAEAWEFLLNQGGALDHFGYRYNLASTKGLQSQLQHLLVFLRGLRLTELKRSSPPPGDAKPGWLANWPSYPEGTAGYDTATASHKYWAALEPAANAVKRQFVLYVHHSSPRCQSGEYSSQGCNGFLSFGGYDARIWTDSRKYRETLDLRLGGTTPKTYLLQWYNPISAGGAPIASKVIDWTPSGTAGSCPAETLVPGKCVVQSEPYEYDIVVKITEQ